MNVRSVVTQAFLLVLTGWSAAYAESVSWLPGSTPPKQWSVDPVHPTPRDTIQFSGPTTVYSNSCVGEQSLGGAPQILVDTKTKVVTLWFQGPVPQVCPTIFSPMAGLKGDFGPLPAGDWTFMCSSRDLSFEIHFTIRDRFACYVDADAPGTVHDGTSWGTALLTLQDALAAAGSGDEIRMAAGVYRPDQGDTATAGSREASFMLKPGLKILGGFAGYGLPRPDARDPAAYVTILSGDLKGNDQGGLLNLNDNSYHVVVGPADGVPGVLEGVTITGGNADGAFPHHYGGGLYNLDGKLQLVNCTFRGNTGVWGGAVMNFGSSVTLVNCQLVGNRALMLGGGLYNCEGDATLINCRVVGSTADYAETAGGAALYNLNGALTVLDSTVADNRSPSGKAIASFRWGTASGIKVKVANSILFNGGNEIWSNVHEAVEVTYSDVQGGWTGTGNISTDPQFTRLGTRSPEGEWIDGDYRLKASSPAIDRGSRAALPTDSFDLDGDGNPSEALPVDLNGNPRVAALQADMGAYEQIGSDPGPGPDWVVLTTANLVYDVPANPPTFPINVSSSSQTTIQLNFQAELRIDIAAASVAGGAWTASFSPDPNPVGPGTATFHYTMHGVGLEVWKLPANTANVKVATVTISARPAP
jgi:hypothetical protein